MEKQSNNVIVRGWAAGKKIFEEALDHDPDDADRDRHMGQLLAISSKWMIEVEFLYMPEEERFLRFGTDKSRMIDPLKFTIE